MQDHRWPFFGFNNGEQFWERLPLFAIGPAAADEQLVKLWIGHCFGGKHLDNIFTRILKVLVDPKSGKRLLSILKVGRYMIVKDVSITESADINRTSLLKGSPVVTTSVGMVSAVRPK